MKPSEKILTEAYRRGCIDNKDVYTGEEIDKEKVFTLENHPPVYTTLLFEEILKYLDEIEKCLKN